MNDENELPQVLRDLVPEVGSWWIWEPEKAHARQRIQVTATKWNGEEAWVKSTATNALGEEVRCWNDFGRWIEATVFDASAVPPSTRSTS